MFQIGTCTLSFALLFCLGLTTADVVHILRKTTTTTEPPPPRPYAFGYAAGRAPGHIDRTHTEVSDGTGVVKGKWVMHQQLLYTWPISYGDFAKIWLVGKKYKNLDFLVNYHPVVNTSSSRPRHCHQQISLKTQTPSPVSPTLDLYIAASRKTAAPGHHHQEVYLETRK